MVVLFSLFLCVCVALMLVIIGMTFRWTWPAITGTAVVATAILSSVIS